MNLVLLLVSVCVSVSALDFSVQSSNHQHLTAANKDPRQYFAEWVARHSKLYSNDLSEYEKRFSIWKANLDYILDYNAKHTSHWLGLNSFADLTNDEYRKYLGYNYALKRSINRLPTPFMYEDVSEDALPTRIDWRAKGAVTEVKNQGQCGSCWAFSTTGSVEGINKIVTGKLVSLSEQELVDCDKGQDNGCRGGLMDYAYQFIINNGGIDTERDYPYSAMDGECDVRKENKHVVSIDNYQDVPENNEVALKKAVAHQPISVAIEADQPSFQLYVGGVYDADDCGTTLDHGVLVVGYGIDEHHSTYWIVKNSWGPEWGSKGYINIKMGIEAKEGQCGIAMAPSFPIKTSPNPSPEPEPSPGPSPSPKPGPGPSPDVQCDAQASCQAGNTCCCALSIGDSCLEWGCCPMAKATCCEDHRHCCPQQLPVCDLKSGRCLAGQNLYVGSVPWSSKTPAIKTVQEE